MSLRLERYELVWVQSNMRGEMWLTKSMALPPEKIPEGLTAREYRRLAILYFLMGNDEKAADAFAIVHSNFKGNHDGELALDSPIDSAVDSMKQKQNSSLSNSGFDEKASVGKGFGMNLNSAVNQLLKRFADADGQDEDVSVDDIVEELRLNLLELGVDKERVEQYLENVIDIVKMARSCDNTPPRVVPTDLSPRELFDLGIHYKKLGWTEQARDALSYCIEADNGGDWGERARCYLEARLPRHPVPLMAEQKNIEGFNKLALGELDCAKKIFRELISSYPDFEWPYGNLGHLRIMEGRLSEAAAVLTTALSINPNYLNGWLHLARVRALEGDLSEARDCLSRASAILPGDKDVRNIGYYLEELAKLESTGE